MGGRLLTTVHDTTSIQPTQCLSATLADGNITYHPYP